MLLFPSISMLQNTLHLCEYVLQYLDIHLKVKQSVHMLFDPRFNATFAMLTILAATDLDGLAFAVIAAFTFSSARIFKCCFDNSRPRFYRSFNASYGRLGLSASPEVTVHLLSSKCMLVILYGLYCCPILNYAYQ